MKKSIRWKLYLGTVILLAFLQEVALISATQIYLSVSHSCITTPGFLMWQCSGSNNPQWWVNGAMLIAPPLVVKLLFNRLKIAISWKKLIALQLITFVTVFLIALVAGNSSVSSGG